MSKTNSLFLFPKDVDWNCELTSLVSTLNDIGLINEKIPDTANDFFAGEQFLNHIAFLGCAPAIGFNATEDKPEFCFIRLISSDEARLIHTKTQVRAPHCPHCKKSLKQWQELDASEPWLCPHCQQSANAYDYDWRRSAGFARIFIEITDIYPKEAIPQSSLLDKLAALTHVQWDYFYYCV